MANSVKDLKFNELPEDLRDNIIKAAQAIREKVKEEMESSDSKPIQKNEWGYDKVREFLVWFQNGVGNARVYKKSNRFSCMIQITGHVDHVEDNPHCEVFRKMIKRAFSKSRSECKKLGFTLVSEGECGEPFEGFDIWTTTQVAKDLWEKFDDKEEKKIQEIKEDAKVEIPPKEQDVNIDTPPETTPQNGEKVSATLNELPRQLQEVIEHTNYLLRECTERSIKFFSENYSFRNSDELLNSIGGFTEESDCIGDTVLWSENGTLLGTTVLTPPIPITSWMEDGLLESVATRFNESFEARFPTKHIILTGDESYAQFEMAYDTEYVGLLWNKLEQNPIYEVAVTFPRKEFLSEDVDGAYTEKIDVKKAALRTVNQVAHAGALIAAPLPMVANHIIGHNKRHSIITELFKPVLELPNLDKPDARDLATIKKTMNAISRVYSDSYMKATGWWKGINIQIVNEREHPYFAFEVPKEMYTKEFAERFINAKENLHKLLRRNSTITIRMNTAALKSLKHPEELYPVLMLAVSYYNGTLEVLAGKIQGALWKLPKAYKKILTESNLYQIVGISLEQLFLFDNVDLHKSKEMFSITKDASKTVVTTIKGLPKKPIQSKEEQDKVLSDFKQLFKAYTECGSERFMYDDFLEALQSFMDGDYDKKMRYYQELYHEEEVDIDWSFKNKDPEMRYLQEKFGVKKLKKIPSDLVAYITIETEAIRDSNDKMMIASYCLSKLEIVEWYIDLLETGSKKYIVPHTLPQLNTIRTQLLACYDRIMRVRITPESERAFLGEIRYPKGYEG